LFEKFFKQIKEYAINTCHIESLILVGSYARGEYKKNSDIDIVIITSKKSEMIENQYFTKEFGDLYKQETEYYGAYTSIRSYYLDGKEVEFGIVDPSWISKPLDAGTRKVLSDGYKVILDKKRHFENLEL
jgi:predicted nucleotidyltransferase